MQKSTSILNVCLRYPRPCLFIRFFLKSTLLVLKPPPLPPHPPDKLRGNAATSPHLHKASGHHTCSPARPPFQCLFCLMGGGGLVFQHPPLKQKKVSPGLLAFISLNQSLPVEDGCSSRFALMERGERERKTQKPTLLHESQLCPTQSE